MKVSLRVDPQFCPVPQSCEEEHSGENRCDIARVLLTFHIQFPQEGDVRHILSGTAFSADSFFNLLCHPGSRGAPGHINLQVIECASGKRNKSMAAQPVPLVNFQQREAMLAALIKSSALQTARITVNPPSVQPVFFPSVDMSQRQIIDFLSAQGAQADGTRISGIARVSHGSAFLQKSSVRPVRMPGHATSRIELPVHHHDIKAFRIQTERGMRGGAVFSCELDPRNRDPPVFSFRIGLPSGTEKKKVLRKTGFAVRTLPAGLPPQTIAFIMVAPQVVESDPGMSGNHRENHISRKSRDSVSVKQVSGNQYNLHSVFRSIICQTSEIAQQFVPTNPCLLSAQMSLQS